MNDIHVSHIMWQPIFNCIMGCNNCYLAESEITRKQKIKTDLIDEIFIKKRLTCKQLTISLDTLTEYPIELVKSLKWLWTFYNSAQECNCKNVTYKSLNGYKLPELCITAFDYRTIERWSTVMDFSLKDFISPLTICSLSNFPGNENKSKTFKGMCLLTKTILNYNRMADWNTDKQPGFWNGIKYSDQIHLVFKKNPLGSNQDIESLKNWTRLRNIIYKLYPDKLIEDSCIQDSIKKLETAFTCGAGINKIHVWPGNIVTGCPYDAHMKVHSNITNNDLYQEIIFSLKERKPCHSMDFCKIPELLQTVKKYKEKMIENTLIKI